jgi:superfamily II DNA or RNA helicase
MDYLKRAEVLPAVLAAPWDVVVVDEAHMVSGESDRRRAMSALCGRTPYVLLLTATPHSGDADAFRALCGLGAVDDRPIVVFRRSRHDVGMSRKRRVGCLMVRPTAAERRMHALLARLSRLTRRHAASPDSALVLGVLHKRACSSPYALAQSVRRRLAALDGDAVPAPQQLALPLLDELGELDEADEPPAMDVALLNDAAEERRMLTALFEAAQAAAGAESKIARLRRLLSRLHSRNEAAIVFTEYRDTLRHVAARLDCRCQLLHGGLRRDERRMVLDNFVSGRCQTLLATDAAGEGLNLQQTCRVVINLELPWNPSRLEQRIGRVDRIGQARQVHAVHLIARDTGEARVLARLRARAAQARADIGAPDVLGDAPRGARDDVPAWLELRGSMSPPAGRPSGYVIGGESRDAADLHRRLACLRASDRARDQADERFAGRTDPDTKVAYSRKRAARALLGDGVLIVVRSVYEDGCGRIVATHLTPLRLRQPRPGTRISEEALVQAAEDWLTPELLRRLDPSIVEWESRTAAAHRAFWGARVERQRAIDQLPGSGSSLLFQPGLFDRRADRQHAASGADEREGRDAARLRELAARAALSANFRPPRPAFVLTRRRR